LDLHGHELEEGLPLNVFISNPERKKERSDADANDREVYVAGLSKFATQEDLENLFRTVSRISYCWAISEPLIFVKVWTRQRREDDVGQSRKVQGLCIRRV
jgi:hypothetical protein